MIDTAKKIAQNIVGLAEHLLANDGAFDVQHYEAYDYSTLLFSLRLTSRNITSDLFKNGEPTEADRKLARKIMGADAPDLERVYCATVELVRPYLLNHAWTKMTECDFSTENDHYAHFHILREECGYAPYSEELLSFLDVTKGNYRFFDKQNALQQIRIVSAQQLRALEDDLLVTTTYSSAEDIEAGKLTDKFESLARTQEDEIISSIAAIAKQSHLTDDEILTFLNLHADQSGQEPIPPPNNDGPALH